MNYNALSITGWNYIYLILSGMNLCGKGRPSNRRLKQAHFFLQERKEGTSLVCVGEGYDEDNMYVLAVVA